jgi:hypothetical protein
MERAKRAGRSNLKGEFLCHQSEILSDAVLVDPFIYLCIILGGWVIVDKQLSACAVETSSIGTSEVLLRIPTYLTSYSFHSLPPSSVLRTI